MPSTGAQHTVHWRLKGSWRSCSVHMWMINAHLDMLILYAYVCVCDSASSTSNMNSGSCVQHRNPMSKCAIASLRVFASVVGGLPAEAASEPFCLCCSGGNLHLTNNASLNLVSPYTTMFLHTENASSCGCKIMQPPFSTAFQTMTVRKPIYMSMCRNIHGFLFLLCAEHSYHVINAGPSMSQKAPCCSVMQVQQPELSYI